MKFIDIHTHNHESQNSIFNVSLTNGDVVIPAGKVFSVGIHPWHLTEDYVNLLPQLDLLANNPNCVAIGECGMDKMINTPEKLQIAAFINHAELAEKLKLPVLIHSVKYYYEILKIRNDCNFTAPWIFHGFNQNIDIALKIVTSGCYISFGTSLENPSKKVKKCVEKIETKHIFFETDDSGENVDNIYKYYCKMKNIPPEELANKIINNLTECFPDSYAKLLA